MINLRKHPMAKGKLPADWDPEFHLVHEMLERGIRDSTLRRELIKHLEVTNRKFMVIAKQQYRSGVIDGAMLVFFPVVILIVTALIILGPYTR